eukprot:g20377.t1
MECHFFPLLWVFILFTAATVLHSPCWQNLLPLIWRAQRPALLPHQLQRTGKKVKSALGLQPGESFAEYLEAATVAYSLYSALDRSVRHSGEALPATSFAVVPVLEQQRAALLMLISALTLTPEQQLLMPGPTKPSFCAIESDDPAALQSWFQEAAECTRRAQVSLHEAQAMLLELDAKCNQEPLMEP